MTLLEQVMALREAGATKIAVSAELIRATFPPLVAASADDGPLSRESVRLQEARALLDAEAEERP